MNQPFRSHLLQLLACLFIFGFGPVLVGQTTGTLTLQMLDSYNQAYIDDLVRGNVASAANLYASDGIFVRSDNSVVQGRDVIAAAIEKSNREKPLVTGKCKVAHLEVVGRQAWETGSCMYIVRSHDVRSRAGGHYMTAWKVQPDGSWKIEVNVSTP